MTGYEVLGVVVRTRRLVVSRAVRRSDGARVLLKELNAAAGAVDGVLGREFDLLRQLHLFGTSCPVEILDARGRELLVLHDRALSPLCDRLHGPASLNFFFPVAVALCDVLAELHARDLVAGTVSPNAILVDDGATLVELSDLSLAQPLPVDVHGLAVASLDPATAGYVAPEQTGRISRTVDHRTDLYALGATCYHLLTGRRPFESDDTLELVHSHIARAPQPPHLVAPAVPVPLSHMVMRLLAKAAEDRYQSALGVRHDLDLAWQQWRDRGTIDAAFELGGRDVSDRLLIPQRLYGREDALAELTAAFEETLEGRPGLLVVGGYAGVGKTAFINELCRPIVRERGYFVSGKFDQVARNVPYGALVQAFRGLVWQLLAASDDQLTRLRASLTTALGPNGGVVAAVIPDIEFIIGRQPPQAPLDAVESQNRFRYVFGRFVATLARPEHPLVLFLDDLQWADAATLDLLQPILTDADPLSLLVIGAYRDNEVTPDHPLSLALDRLEREAARVRRLTLGPLDAEHLRAFLMETLRAPAAEVNGLADLIREKTDGNPFFVIQFLQSLQHERLLTLDRRTGHWTYRLDQIAAAERTDNVVTLMTQRIRRLSADAQSVLRLAACIGSPFQWTTFMTATRVARDRAEAGLEEALAAALVRPAESQYDAQAARPARRGAYAFIHDRVQQAAYALIPETERPAVHLDVGRQLLAECGPDVPEEQLFAIVNHLNVGAALIQDETERLMVARMNLAAARKARTSAAYDAAVGYATAGLAVAARAQGSATYELLFGLHFEHAECLFLAGSFEEAEHVHAALLAQAATPLDRAAVHELRITFYENRSRYAEAMASAREALQLFGIALAETESGIAAALDAELDAIRELRAGRPIASLLALPVMADVETRMVMRILTLMWAPAYLSGNQRLTSLISATMVRLSLQHGNAEDSAYGYVTHAITVGPVRQQFAEAGEWGDLAIAVNERFGDLKRRAKIHQQVHAHVKLWRHPFAACIPHAREAARAGLEAGDFAYAGYAAATESWPAFMAATDLRTYVADYTPALAFLARVNMSGFRDALLVMLNWARALQGGTAAPISLTTADLDETAYIARYATTAPLFMTVLRCAHLHLCVVFDEPARGLDAALRAREVTVPGTMWPVLEQFWGALARAAAFERATLEERRSHREHIAAAGASLGLLAANCPENFLCPSLLVAAVQETTENGLTVRARGLFEQAVSYATASGNVHHEALASDLFGRALLRTGDDAAALDTLARAYRAYGVWGAAAKQRHMRRRYPQLAVLPERATEPFQRPDAASTLAALDVRSVLKVAQVIAGEIEVDGLLRTVLTVAIENAGAERGLFLQARDGDAVPMIAARATNDTVEARPATQEDVGPLAEAVIRYVRRTRQDVVISDPERDERFSGHARTERDPQSVLCVPVAYQGRMNGILYLDHVLSGAFTAARIEIIRVLAAQAAIAFDNAQLYAEMKAEVERRAAAEAALRDALGEVQSLKNRLEAENVYLQEEIGTQHNFNEIVGHAPALLEALRRVERVAPTDSTVLILGETGSGKELFARAVHSRSRRNSRPLVKVNCGAIAPGLVESELFGHVKGAFTGAIDKRVGRFELANGGTIFLDEIGELPLEAQVKLLRVLQEQEFEPVGSSRTVRVSVRVIAATNRNLDQAVRDGRFRVDLLYRLNVFPIDIPPLRQRTEDIPLLVGFFLSRISRTLGKPLQGVTARSMEQIQRYDWPGNVRELQNVLERAAILAESPFVDLGPALTERAQAPASPAPAARGSNLDAVQRDHILSVLASTNGIIEGARGAAVRLGVHPNTLRSRMKKLGITARRAGSA